MGVEETKKEITKVWKELGRDTKKLKLDNKSAKDLDRGLEQLKTVQMSFKILFETEGNHNLALAMLEGAFKSN